jgi:hypothetical protein
MSHQLKAQWKDAKRLLKDNGIKIPKAGKFERLKTTMGFVPKISASFDALDGALENGDLVATRKAFDDLKPKAETFLGLASSAKAELLVSDKDKAAVMDKVIKSVQGLLMVARADLVQLKDKAEQSKDADEKKLADWEKKLGEMSKLVGDTILKDLNSIIISADGATDLLQKMAAKLPKAEGKDRDQIAKQLKQTREELKSELERYRAVDAKAKQLLPALAAYAQRKGMEKLGKDNKTVALARARSEDAEEFIRSAKVKLTAAQGKAAVLAGDILK